MYVSTPVPSSQILKQLDIAPGLLQVLAYGQLWCIYQNRVLILLHALFLLTLTSDRDELFIITSIKIFMRSD